MTTTDYVLLVVIGFLIIVCLVLKGLLHMSEYDSKNWEELYLKYREKSKELLRENIELKAKAKQK